MGIQILIPAKSASGKKRLASVLDERAREQLCLEFLINTIHVAVSVSNTIVIAQDATAAAIAEKYNTTVCVEPPGAGLNGALDAGRACAAPGDGLLVCPIDLPFITSETLCRICDSSESISIVPDRDRLGTNLLWLPPAAVAGFQFMFGPKSFSRHSRQAEDLGLPLRTPSLPEAQLDIDQPEDLAMWRNSEAYRQRMPTAVVR
jgi:2-phospho-L-lactate guanylyltransferase